MPSPTISLEEISNEKILIDKLMINQIPSANPIFWPQNATIENIENKIQEFFEIYELNSDLSI
jgi:hypothetical protein